MEEQRKSENALVPALRFEGFSDPWEQRKAGDRLVVLRGGSPRPIESYITSDPSGVNWIKIGDVEPGSMYITRTSERIRREGVSKSREVFAGDLLLSNSMSFGRPYILQVNGCIHDGWLLIRDAEGRFDTIFLQQMLSTPSMARQYKALAAGGVVNNLNSELVQSATIAFPGKAEQIKIGALFQKLDSLIALHQRKHEKLKTVKQSLLEKMFPKEGEDVPELRFEGFTDPWEQRRLGEICDEVTRRNPLSEAPVMMITAESGFIEQSERYSTDNAGESLQKYIVLRRGELAYNHGASKLRPFGSCFNLLADEARIPFVYHCFSLRSDCPAFTSLELNGGQVEDQLRTLVSSGARMDGLLNISFEEYQTVRLLLPSLDEQRQIAGLFAKLDSLIALHQRELDILKNLKQALLEKMFV